jgi:hypothetical protein
VSALTVAKVRQRVEKIRRDVNDDESCHAEEDALYADVLKAIVNGADDPVGLAAAALETEKIRFSRWYA